MPSRARHCLACGRALRPVRQDGRRRQRCPRCGWIFYDNPVPAAVAIVEGRDGILLARRLAAPYAGTWDLPGGFIEAGELPGPALLRELREELGARATIVRLETFSIDRYGPGGVPVLAIVYVARLRAAPTARSDVSEVRWFRRDAIPWREIGFPSIRRCLRAYLARRPARGRPGSRARRAPA